MVLRINYQPKPGKHLDGDVDVLCTQFTELPT